MNKFLSAGIIGLSLLALPGISLAQPYHGPNRGPVHTQKHGVAKKHVAPQKHRWSRGHALPSQYRRNYVGDYHRYHLRAPGPGQRWVRVDNQFVLINTVSGLIAAFAAAR